MLCDNCGENEANIKYTEIINGVKKEMHLCKKCSEELGMNNLSVSDFNFDIPMNMSSFLADFLGDVQNDFLPSIGEKKQLKCNECGTTYEEFLDNGKFGCGNCYEIFSSKIDSILKGIHNGNRHVGRQGIENSIKFNKEKNENEEIIGILESLQIGLKNAIKEERYEDAAKIRDEIKKIQEK